MQHSFVQNLSVERDSRALIMNHLHYLGVGMFYGGNLAANRTHRLFVVS